MKAFKHMIYILNLILFFVPSFGYSAADPSAKKISSGFHTEGLDNDLIGISCNKKGTLGLIASITSDPEATYAITLTYSELPELQISGMLKNIAQYIFEKHINCDSKKLKVLCAQEIAMHISLESDSFPERTTPINYELIALCIKLNKDTIKNAVFTQYTNQEPQDAQCKYVLDDTLKYAVSNGHAPIPSTRRLDSCQKLAEELHITHPEEPFHLVINFDAWRTHIKPAPNKKKKSKLLPSKQSSSTCALQ